MSNGASLTIDTAASPRHSSSALGNARKKCLPPTIMHSAGPRGADRPDADSAAPREIASIIPSTEQLVGGMLSGIIRGPNQRDAHGAALLGIWRESFTAFPNSDTISAHFDSQNHRNCTKSCQRDQ